MPENKAFVKQNLQADHKNLSAYLVSNPLIWFRRYFTATQRRLMSRLLWLQSKHNKDTFEHALGSLAKASGMSICTASKTIDKLAAYGLIAKQSRLKEQKPSIITLHPIWKDMTFRNKLSTLFTIVCLLPLSLLTVLNLQASSYQENTSRDSKRYYSRDISKSNCSLLAESYRACACEENCSDGMTCYDKQKRKERRVMEKNTMRKDILNISSISLTTVGQSSLMAFPEAAIKHADKRTACAPEGIQDPFRYFVKICHEYVKEHQLPVDWAASASVFRMLGLDEETPKLVNSHIRRNSAPVGSGSHKRVGQSGPAEPSGTNMDVIREKLRKQNEALGRIPKTSDGHAVNLDHNREAQEALRIMRTGNYTTNGVYTDKQKAKALEFMEMAAQNPQSFVRSFTGSLKDSAEVAPPTPPVSRHDKMMEDLKDIQRTDPILANYYAYESGADVDAINSRSNLSSDAFLSSNPSNAMVRTEIVDHKSTSFFSPELDMFVEASYDDSQESNPEAEEQIRLWNRV